jgi:hypothetical protein
MKYIASLLLSLACVSVFASENTDRILELKTEISQREKEIALMKKEDKPTGRFEMTVLRLRKELERRELTEQMLTTTKE